MSIRTNPMKAVPVVLKRLKKTRSIFQRMERDESFDEKLEILTWELNNIEDVFMRVKQNQDELLDALTEVDGHLRKLDRKRLEDMEGICKRIRDCTRKLLPMDAIASDQASITKAFDSSRDHKSEKLHSDPSSTQHNNELLLSLGASQAITKPSDSSQDHKSEEAHSDPSSSQHKNELLDEGFTLRLDEEMDDIRKRIKDSAHELLPMDAFDDSSTQHNNQLPLDQDVDLLRESYHKLEIPLRDCLTSLVIFPEDAVIKKRHTIYWWIGEWMVENTEEKTAEEVGEDVIDELLKINLIVPYGNGKCPLVNKFQINPHIRPHLESLGELREKLLHLGYYLKQPLNLYCLVLEQQKVTLDDGVILNNHIILWSVFNVGASYLNIGSQWLAERKYLWALQLGRWQDSPSHHIEVGNQEFLKELRDQEHLLYLSLRGISKISELPPSIAQLETLKILDLKACHNLKTLPNDISSMKSLTHLILSRCYLLDGMPKGIEKLSRLQVLKGFVLGSSRTTPCRISDLAKLKKLRRLSIHIGSEAVIKDGEFESLGELSALVNLKISWGLSGKRYTDIQIVLPSSLKKLHLEDFPGQKIPEWLKPSKLPRGLKVLNITKGKLERMNHDEEMNKWGMEMVRLKYLKHLKVELTNLKELFPLLRYAEIKQVSNHSYIEWSIDD